MTRVQPPSVPSGTLAALLDALPRVQAGDPDQQMLGLAWFTGFPRDRVRAGLDRLAWYRMARRRADGTWRLTWRVKP